MKRIEGVLAVELPDPQNPKGKRGVRLFEGQLFGAETSAARIRDRWKTFDTKKRDGAKDKGWGEVVFNTAMTGYQEILTDPSYYGQLVCMTVPHIGNTGVNPEDVESIQAWASGFIVHDLSPAPSNWRASGDLETYLKEAGIPGIQGVDTRALTRQIRTLGAVRGLILPKEDASQAAELFELMPPFEGRDLIREVTTEKPYRWRELAGKFATPHRPETSANRAPHPEGGKSNQLQYKVVTLDFGVKFNSLRSLDYLGCDVEVMPADSSAEEILARKPDGIFLSNGPGDPAAASYAVETVRQLVGKVPVFGICMGHQILSLAAGGKTYKLKFGHHGGNQPVLDQETGRVEISSQNHGYAVDAESLPEGAEVTHINLNDKTVEGIRVRSSEIPAFSVQYHPEACPGPHDSMVLFNRFIEAMRAYRK